MQPTVPDRGDADDQNINGGGAQWSTETLVLLVLLVLLFIGGFIVCRLVNRFVISVPTCWMKSAEIWCKTFTFSRQQSVRTISSAHDWTLFKRLTEDPAREFRTGPAAVCSFEPEASVFG